ncbi:MAG: molybdate ABC transporter substrate-binding protein [Nitrospira sp.]|nr:molybdate ABC transporter substrate-binding protein [Nitrospira sp.]
MSPFQRSKRSEGCPWIFSAILVIAFFTGTGHVAASEILVAAAADLNFAIKDIVAEFERQTGHRVRLSLGSSGHFYAQISNGAPFDIFFSADIDFPRKLIKAGLTVPETLFSYAVGRIVVWVPKQSPIDVEKLGISALLAPSVKKIAIANPKHAPYGRAAVAALKHFGLYDKVESKFVLGENISQTAHFIQSGSAEIGIIALSLAAATSLRQAGRFWEIPLTAYPRMEQGGVILMTAEKTGHYEAVKQFRDWVTSRHGRAVLKQYGFYLPEEPREQERDDSRP